MANLRKILEFYVTGFKGMTVGKTLWAIILIKLVVLFLVLRLFFFQPALGKYSTPQEKGEKVIENLIKNRQ